MKNLFVLLLLITTFTYADDSGCKVEKQCEKEDVLNLKESNKVFVFETPVSTATSDLEDKEELKESFNNIDDVNSKMFN